MSKQSSILTVYGAIVLGILCGPSAHGALLYDNSTDTLIASFGNLDAGVIVMDDVAIPAARQNSLYLEVKQVVTDIYVPNGLAGRVSAWWAPAKNDAGKA